MAEDGVQQGDGHEDFTCHLHFSLATRIVCINMSTNAMGLQEYFFLRIQSCDGSVIAQSANADTPLYAISSSISFVNK